VEDRKARAREANKEIGGPAPAVLPAEVLALWDRKDPQWRRAGAKGATHRVGRALHHAVGRARANGVDLWDTMRGGSDYWRPGKLLSEAGQVMDGDQVTFQREDALCPPADLLQTFRNSQPAMSFAQYAQDYADWLLGQDRIDLAVAAIIRAQARSRVAVFYCTDPFVPGYADAGEWLSETTFAKRRWPLAGVLRDEGCHRVVLAELLAQRLRQFGMNGRVLEVDPTREGATELAF
jgi:hypothetical protein